MFCCLSVAGFDGESPGCSRLTALLGECESAPGNSISLYISPVNRCVLKSKTSDLRVSLSSARIL